jgi:hypothetical protein
MELIGVTGGALNSTYTTFGDDLPVTVAGYIPAVPMVALAAAEFGRVPLASAVYDKHRVMQAVAVLGILALGYLALENWTFGFDRVVDLRLKPVNAAARELARAEAEFSRVKDQRDHLDSRERQTKAQRIAHGDKSTRCRHRGVDRAARQGRRSTPEELGWNSRGVSHRKGPMHGAALAG